ncbi:MAG: hypothetical protein QW416_05580 [Candidatus Nitrosocaldaceae archaeon]
MVVAIGDKAPNLKVMKWVQGLPTNIDREKDKVILIEVFQVNCPGCFLYGLPEAIRIYNTYKNDDVRVLALATAFEDFDKNTLENLELLVRDGIVIGETERSLREHGLLRNGKLPYKIPFPVAMDMLVKSSNISKEDIIEFIKLHVPDYASYSNEEQRILFERVSEYLKRRVYTPLTFDEYGLNGTPSSIIIDREGIVRHISFGFDNTLEYIISSLLK